MRVGTDYFWAIVYLGRMPKVPKYWMAEEYRCIAVDCHPEAVDKSFKKHPYVTSKLDISISYPIMILIQLWMPLPQDSEKFV
jgi:hypothetical protein